MFGVATCSSTVSRRKFRVIGDPKIAFESEFLLLPGTTQGRADLFTLKTGKQRFAMAPQEDSVTAGKISLSIECLRKQELLWNYKFTDEGDWQLKYRKIVV